MDVRLANLERNHMDNNYWEDNRQEKELISKINVTRVRMLIGIWVSKLLLLNS